MLHRIRLVALAAAIVLAYVASPAMTAAQESEPTGGMALRVEGAGVSCDDEGCTVPLNGDFTLSVLTDGIPAGGYLAIQTHLYFGGLVYLPSDSEADENVWPDNSLPLRDNSVDQYLSHGGLTSLTPPFALSTFEGALVELAMRCVGDDATVRLALLSYDVPANPLGSSYSLEENLLTVSATVIGEMELDPLGSGELRLVDVSAVLPVTCGAGGAIADPPLLTVAPTLEPTGMPEPPELTATAESQVAAVETVAAATAEAVATFIELGTPAAFFVTGEDEPTLGEDGDENGVEVGDDDGGGNTGLWIVIGVVVAVALVGAGVVGWRYYQQRQNGSGDGGPPSGSSPPSEDSPPGESGAPGESGPPSGGSPRSGSSPRSGASPPSESSAPGESGPPSESSAPGESGPPSGSST